MCELREPLRDRIGRAIYEEPGHGLNWYSLSEEKREDWRRDADRVIAQLNEEYAQQSTDARNIKDRLREACNGKPATIQWPHRLLHDAIAEIERLESLNHKSQG
jgi:hypothetical protein